MQHRIGRRWRIAAAALALSVVTAACGSGGGTSDGGADVPEAEKNGGTLNIGLSADPTGVDAAVVNQVWRHVARALSDSLVFFNPETKELEPWLAESWTEKDAKLYTFKLREDVTFPDGTKLTSDVVKKNFESLARPGIHSSAAAIVDGIKEIRTPSEFDVEVEFSKPNAAFLTSLSRAHGGIVSEKTAALPVEERQNWIEGSGPFVLKEYKPNQQIVIEKREDYDWAPEYFGRSGPARLDKVVYKIIPEDSVRNGAVINGEELQFIYWVNAKYVDQLKAGGLTITETLNPSTGTEWPVNTSSKFLKDVRVRQALQHAIDREEFVKLTSLGHDQAPKGPLSEENPFFSDQSEHLTYDPKLSVKLLEAAGWDTVGKDGIRTNAKGERLSLRFPRDLAAEQVVQEQFKKVGVELVLDAPLPAEANEKLLSGEYDLAYWYHSTPDSDVLRANYGAASGSNRSFIAEDDEVGQRLDALLQKQNTVTDKAERQKIVDEAAELLVEQAYTLPIATDSDIWAFQPSVKELTAVGLDQYLYNTWLSKK